MEPMFEVAGWSLPTTVASESSKKKKKANKEADGSLTEMTKEADRLQQQWKQVNPSQKSKKRSRSGESAGQPQQNAPDLKKNKKQKKKKLEKEKAKDKKETQPLSTTDHHSKEKELIEEAVTTPNPKPKPEPKIPVPTTKLESPSTPSKADEKLTPLQRKMKDKLSGAHFRWLNEQLYTTTGDTAQKLFSEKPELFDVYHTGFRHQVESWPTNPVDVIIDQIKELPDSTIIADLGCGDAAIAQALPKHKVLSYDLIAKNNKVIACDIAHLPLPSSFVDVAIFSLSLMGTNYFDFLTEAHRVLKPGGELKIAEVVSRFPDIDSFVVMVESLGFDLIDKDDNNKMFVMFNFIRREEEANSSLQDEELLKGLSPAQARRLRRGASLNVSRTKLRKKSQHLLNPCVYKKR